MATVAAKAASAWWMADVEKAHETLLSLIDELEALTGAAAPDMARVAGVRWKLSQASRQDRKSGG